MDRCTLGVPFFLSFYVVVYIINSATETVVRRDVPLSPCHITLIEYNEVTSLPVFPSISTPQGGYNPLLLSSPLISTTRGNPSIFSLISTPQEPLVSLNFNTRRNLWPSCILLPLNVNHRTRGNSSNLAICSSFYGFNATGEIDPVQHCSGGTSLSLSVATRLSPSSVSTSFVCPRFDPRRWGIPPATSSTSVLMPGGGKPLPLHSFAFISTPEGGKSPPFVPFIPISMPDTSLLSRSP